MNSFGNKERIIAKLLSNNPMIKNIIKRIYQYINYFLYKKKYRLKSNFKISEVDDSDLSSFFGYYDKSPENFSGTKVIYYRSKIDTKNKPSEKDSIQIILKCLKTNTTEVIDETFSYNWQQGAKMMWMTDDKFIYNIFSKSTNSYHSKIYDVNNKTFKSLDIPVYECFKDVFIYSLNFSRLMDLRPDYGYRNNTPTIDYDNYENDGIFKLNIKDNSYSLIISLKQLIELNPLLSMKGAKHKVNHIMINPDGTKFMFMHRWITKSGKRYDRLLISDSKHGNFKIVSDGGMVSHCCWKDNSTIVGYLRHNNTDGFYKIDLNNLSITNLSNKLKEFSDGHPTFHSNYMVFDSYPDRSRMKYIYIYNIINDEVTLMGEFFESLKFYNESRCDLHPRLNNNKDKIYFDSVHDGYRSLYYLEFNL